MSTLTALNDLARILLLQCDRPVPRLINRVCDIAVPHALFPQLERWQITTLRIQPQPTGMYVAALNPDHHSMAAAWWPARPDAAERNPISFPAAAWALLHPVLAGIWHDLCADAIPLPDPQPRSAPEPRTPPTRHRQTSRMRILPTARAIPRVAWASPDDCARIARACALRGDYRRLPSDWEQRSGNEDFITRRQAAAERASRYGYPPPPPGFTFVRPHTRGIGAPPEHPHDPHGPLLVKSRGLFTVALGLQAIPEQTDDEE